MKCPYLKTQFLVLGALTLAWMTMSAGAATRTCSVDLKIGATAINKFIAAQSFPTITTPLPNGGMLYSLSITKPVVTLNAGSATAHFVITAYSTLGNFSWTVDPTITIPNVTVTASQVIAMLQGFDGLINARSDIPAVIKPIIISTYNSLNLVMYPSRLIDYANSLVPDFIDIRVTDIGVSLAVVPGSLSFTLSASIVGTPPQFAAQWMKRAPYQASVRFTSSVATTLKMVRVNDVRGASLYINGGLNIPIAKGGASSQIDIGGVAVDVYYITAYFHSAYGDYARRYYFSFNTATYNTWFPATYASGIN